MTTASFTLPSTVAALIDLLDTAFPLSNPHVNDSVATIQRRAGQRDVVEFLRRLQVDAAEDAGLVTDDGST